MAELIPDDTGKVRIAYFSMEIAVRSEIPTYSGGLGVLAGDTIRAAADAGVPMAAVTLLHRKGYFRQRIDRGGWQTEVPADWVMEDHLEETALRATVGIEGRQVQIRAWRYSVKGVGGHLVPVYFLDTDLPENIERDRRLTDVLYGGDAHYRLRQEVVLGMGGVRMLRALGYKNIQRFHMNEGHAALLTVRLLAEEVEARGQTTITRECIEAVRRKCVFTTHTPVPAGHDRFPMDLVSEVIPQHRRFLDLKDVFTVDLMGHVLGRRQAFFDVDDLSRGDHHLNMTYLALYLSHYVNGVAKRHGEVAREIFAEYGVDSITNGVHAATWVSPPFATLFDRHIPGWRQDNFSLRAALSIPGEEVWLAHVEAKRTLLARVNREAHGGVRMEEGVLTIGFARRAATYKRADLLFHDVERLRRIAAGAGPLQLIYAGKAHPQDRGGKEMIQQVFRAAEELRGAISLVYLEDYDMEMAAQLTAGVDLWLNTPEPPLEASGTSGMKAAMNGVPSLSILDGWWIEGCIEGVTGWAIGRNGSVQTLHDRATDAGSLYGKLEHVIVPKFYGERDRFVDVMRHSIALNGSFFNTQRMMQQYVLKAYFE